jgi:type I restriction enzyme S subunit
MPAVDEQLGKITKPEVRSCSDVRKGYTYFTEGDVLFAKITPCMQNGKHAIARNLIDGVGFGSTEFHVIRPGPHIVSEWIHRYLRQTPVLRAATAYFTGAVGQQRVPESFLASLEIPLPPLSEQRRIVAILNEQMAAVEKARAAAEGQLEAARSMPAAYLSEVFSSPEAQQWPRKRLGEVLRLRQEVVHPCDNPRGSATFVGLEHIESGSGARTGSVAVEMSELTGRKPRFYKGDIVYGYLRPYLNKVWVAEFDGLCSVDQYVYTVDAAKADVSLVSNFMRSSVYLQRAPISKTPGQLPRIRTEEVASVELNLPSLSEQKRITTRLNEQLAAVGKIRAGLEGQLDLVNLLPAAFLRRAFNGEL